MKAEYDLSKLKSRKNPYVSKLKKQTKTMRQLIYAIRLAADRSIKNSD